MQNHKSSAATVFSAITYGTLLFLVAPSSRLLAKVERPRLGCAKCSPSSSAQYMVMWAATMLRPTVVVYLRFCTRYTELRCLDRVTVVSDGLGRSNRHLSRVFDTRAYAIGLKKGKPAVENNVANRGPGNLKLPFQ